MFAQTILKLFNQCQAKRNNGQKLMGHPPQSGLLCPETIYAGRKSRYASIIFVEEKRMEISRGFDRKST